MVAKLLSALNSMSAWNAVRFSNYFHSSSNLKILLFTYILLHEHIKICMSSRDSSHILTVKFSIPDLPILQNSLNSILNFILTLYDIKILA